MRYLSRQHIVGSMVTVSTLIGCAGSDETTPQATDDGPLRVLAVNEPLAYMARRIGGDAVEVSFPAPADVDPALWSPDPETITLYQRADLVLLNGAGYAGWTAHASLPDSRLVITTRSVEERLLKMDGAVTHNHGPGGEHAHEGTAFTTWLDLSLAVEQARAVRDAFAARRPREEQSFTHRFDALRVELESLHEELVTIGRDLDGAPLLFSHPVYQYLRAAYALNGLELHWEPDVVPTDREWAGLGDELRAHPAAIMVWEAAADPATVRRLDDMGIRSVVFDPCANAPSSGDFLDVMRRNVQGLRAAAAPRGDR